MAMDATPNAIWRLRSGERTQPGGPTRRRARLRRHSPHTDIHTTTHHTHVCPPMPYCDAVLSNRTSAVHRLQNGTAAVPKRAQRKMSAMMDILRFTSITIAKSASTSASGRKMNVPSAANPHTLNAQNR